MNLYFISGLGADERVFQRLKFPDSIKVIHIIWPQTSADETLHSYRDKIISLIDTSQEFGIVGLSFGGIIATEISKVLKPSITILLSSVTNCNEMPWAYKLSGKLKLNKLVPVFLLNKVYPFTNWYFGVKEQTDKKLLRSVIQATSPYFLKWAVNQIINWKNLARPDNILHIHGDRDRLFPVKLTKADMIINNAGHLMVYTHAQLISRIIIDRINNRQ